MARKIQFRRGTAASWTSTDPTLAIGELGLETDTGKIKIGDGVTAWSARPYIDAAALAHIADTSAAHAAASIASTPAGTLAATDVQAALNELDTEKAPLASPALTGTPTAPTAATATNTTQVATTAFVRANRAEQAAADISQFVGQTVTQTAESAAVQAFKIAFADGRNTPFEIRAIDYDNAGTGTGTTNHLTFIGYNTGRHATGTVTTGKAAWMMGIEDNYYANGGDEKYGPEWYVQYFSPDGTSQEYFRPFYARVLGSDSNTPCGAINISNIGPSGANGSFAVNGGIDFTGDTQLFKVAWGQITMSKPVYVSNSAVTVASTTASTDANLYLDAQRYPQLFWRINGSLAFYAASSSVNNLAFYDKGFNAHMTFTYGATAAAAITDFRSGVKVQGGFSAFNATLVTTKPTVTGSKGANAALTSLLTALATYGLITDSSS